MAYCGSGYYGLQYNVKTEERLPTIEGEIFRALKKTGLVPDDVLEEPKKMSYNSASRTDKGVSALGQVLSFKIKMADDFQAVLNKQLPEHIRVMNVVRTTKNFVAKNKCEYRTYSYMLPAFAIKEHSEILKPLKAKIKTACSKDFTVWYEKQLAECENTKIFPTELEGHKEFRATEQDIKRFDDILKKYVGTHSFHNFTSGVKMGEATAKRVIKDCKVNRAYMPEFEGYQWIEVKIIGQSFMIHQIRKMIGLALAIMSGWADFDHWNRSFSERFEDIPRAPADGLLLESVHYDNYNNWLAEGAGNAGILATPIVWDYPSMQEEIKDFKEKFVTPLMIKNMLSLDEKEGFMSWLENLKMHDYTGMRAKQQAHKNALGQKVEGDMNSDSDEESKGPVAKKSKKGKGYGYKNN